MLDARLEYARGAFTLDVALTCAAGETLVLVGESGSGKTTALRLLAGLDRPAGGHVRVDGETWSDASTWMPVEQRCLGYVAQGDTLFPHLDAFANVAFGLRALGAPDAEVKKRTMAALERTGASAWAGRKPNELSGGQRQRVALARALVLEPSVLLLDEPLSALDPATRRALRADLTQRLSGTYCATVMVTHSPVDALALGDRIAAIENGRIVQAGDRTELLLRPRSSYVADFLGLNLFKGILSRPSALDPAVLQTDHGLVEIAADDTLADGAACYAVVEPRDVTLALAAPDTSARNVVAGLVLEVVPEPPHGERVRVAIDGRPPLVAEVTRASVAELGLRAGLRVYASFKSSGVKAYGSP